MQKLIHQANLPVALLNDMSTKMLSLLLSFQHSALDLLDDYFPLFFGHFFLFCQGLFGQMVSNGPMHLFVLLSDHLCCKMSLSMFSSGGSGFLIFLKVLAFYFLFIGHEEMDSSNVSFVQLLDKSDHLRFLLVLGIWMCRFLFIQLHYASSYRVDFCSKPSILFFIDVVIHLISIILLLQLLGKLFIIFSFNGFDLTSILKIFHRIILLH